MQQQIKTFAVPVTAGQYAPETLELRTSGLPLDMVHTAVVLVETLPTGAQIEIDLLRPGAPTGSPAESDWILNQITGTASGLYDPARLNFRARIRVKSGGTAGTPKVSVGWTTTGDV